MKKKLWIGLGILILLIITIYFTQETFAKYRKKIDGQAQINIANWNIKVNNESIAGKNDLTTTIVPTFLATPNTKENVIAPGSVGYYDIIINALDVDVSFSYTIFSSTDPTSNIKDLVTTAYEINPSASSVKTTYSSNTGITGSVNHNTNQITIRIHIKWNDNPTEQTMTNADDTNAAINNTSKAIMKVNLHFSQLNI
ncbi:MAG: hypothetical protein RSC85_00235 [Bacilli bacterium]